MLHYTIVRRYLILKCTLSARRNKSGEIRRRPSDGDKEDYNIMIYGRPPGRASRPCARIIITVRAHSARRWVDMAILYYILSRTLFGLRSIRRLSSGTCLRVSTLCIPDFLYYTCVYPSSVTHRMEQSYASVEHVNYSLHPSAI